MKPAVVVLVVIATAVLSALTTAFVIPLLPREETSVEPTALAEPQAEDASAADMAHLRDQLARAQARIAELETASVATAPETPAPEPAAEPAAPAETAKASPTLDEIRKALGENSAAKAQFQALTELIFADLLNDLNLDPETKAALRELLLDAQIEELALAQYAMTKGDIPWSEVAQWRDDERALLDEQIRALLSPEKYKTWQEYAAAIDEHSLEGNLRNQIRAFASGLTNENFEVVMQVAIEEFLAEQDALNDSNTPFTAEENLRYQIRAMEEMRERLQQYLPADQFSEINNWLNMGINMFEQQLASMGASQ